MPELTDVVIIGASTRAAAFSALRAGLRPWCSDLFGDADLARVCPVVQVCRRDYPARFLRLLQDGPPAPLMYVGALENRPRLIRQLAQIRELWGNDANVLLRVRHPLEIASYLKRIGLPCPDVHRSRYKTPHHKRWLVKPLASAGGHGIHLLAENEYESSRNGCYLQEHIEGIPCAALYVGDNGQSHFLGVTLQLVGETWLHAKPFHYCGSVGPLSLEQGTDDAFAKLGNVLVDGFGLRGLFGIDCILCDGVPCPVEINPRYTASVEVWEHAMGQSAIAMHARAFNSLETVAFRSTLKTPAIGDIVGKAVLFAQNDLIVPTDAPWMEALDQPVNVLREFGDIPQSTSHIEKGSPIVSVFARAASVTNCINELKQRVSKLDQWLYRR